MPVCLQMITVKEIETQSKFFLKISKIFHFITEKMKTLKNQVLYNTCDEIY